MQCRLAKTLRDSLIRQVTKAKVQGIERCPHDMEQLCCHLRRPSAFGQEFDNLFLTSNAGLLFGDSTARPNVSCFHGTLPIPHPSQEITTPNSWPIPRESKKGVRAATYVARSTPDPKIRPAELLQVGGRWRSPSCGATHASGRSTKPSSTSRPGPAAASAIAVRAAAVPLAGTFTARRGGRPGLVALLQQHSMAKTRAGHCGTRHLPKCGGRILGSSS